MLLIGLMALISTLMLWWANHLYRSAFPGYIVLTDNLQQARRSATKAVILQEKILSGEAMGVEAAFAALDNAALGVADCISGRSTLVGIPGEPPREEILLLLRRYGETLAQLDMTVRARLEGDSEQLRIAQLQKLYEGEQLAAEVETLLGADLAAMIASQQTRLMVGVGLWFLALAAALVFLLRLSRIEARQAEQERLLETLIESTPDAIYIKDRQGRYLLCNGGAAGYIGRPVAEILGNDDSGNFPAPVAARLAAKDREVIDGAVTCHLTEEIETLDGRRRVVTVVKGPIRDRQGVVTGVFGISRDITEQKRLEDSIRDSELRYRLLFTQSMDAIAIMDQMPPRFRLVNPAFVDLFGYTTEELAPMRGAEIWRLVHPDEVRLVEESLRQRMENGVQSTRYDFRIVRKDGEVRWVEATGTRVEVAGGVMNQSIYRDITRRRQAEEDRQRLTEQLLQAQKMESVGRLAGGVAHDFNNQLSVILGFAEFLEEGLDEDSPLRDDVAEIKKAASHSADLTRQLLAFARKQTVAPKVIVIDHLVETLLKMIRRLIGEDISLTWVPAPIPWKVRIDPSQVDQILVNLCVNAKDAVTAGGSISIESRNAVLDEAFCADHVDCCPGEYVQLVVRDNGRGMDKETLDKVFEPFFTTKEVGAGTGLGLSTVYGIVRQNLGCIVAQSEVGRGTSFSIYLPRARGDEEDIGETPAEPLAFGQGKAVLLVEDARDLLFLDERILRGFGFTVRATSSPEEALRCVRDGRERFDLLLTDVIMPEMNGRELAEKLVLFLPSLRVLYMSGYTANVIAHHGVIERGLHFLQKPFSRQELAQKLRQTLSAEHAASRR